MNLSSFFTFLILLLVKVSFSIEETTFFHTLTAFKGVLILILRIIFYKNAQYGDFTSIPSGEQNIYAKKILLKKLEIGGM